ncbi:MAG: PfkB family carbohydrate kinase [Burkholderiaceae bacterium]
MIAPTPFVICLGLCTLDQTWNVARIPQQPVKVLADGYTTSGGGMAATAAVTVARLGGRAAFWGRAGQDPTGLLIRAGFEQEQVDVGALRLFEGAQSPIAAVLVDADGERLIANFPGANLPDAPHWLPIHQVGGAQAVLADMRWISGAIALFEAARDRGIPTVLDADFAPTGDFGRILPLTDYALFSSAGLASYAGNADAVRALGQARAQGCVVAGVTRGARGTLWLDARGEHRTPAFAVRTIDTTGAGDVFHGAYAFCIGTGQSAAQAARFAAATAALKCRHPGGRQGIPRLEEVEQFLAAANADAAGERPDTGTVANH